MDPKTIFFEWTDFEEEIWRTLPSSSGYVAKFLKQPFELASVQDAEAISIFVDSRIDDSDLQTLAERGVKVIAIRAAGMDMLNVSKAKELGINVYRVASYSSESVAEHAFALLLALTRRLTIARKQHEAFDNLRSAREMGIALYNKRIGFYGLGRTGKSAVSIAKGLNMRPSFVDPFVKEFAGVTKVNQLKELAANSDILMIFVPLNEETRFSINADVLNAMPQGAILINTARADIVDADAVVTALKSGQLWGIGVDVWDNLTGDDMFDERLLQYNAIQTNHIAFLTREGVTEILAQTLESLRGNIIKENVVNN